MTLIRGTLLERTPHAARYVCYRGTVRHLVATSRQRGRGSISTTGLHTLQTGYGHMSGVQRKRVPRMQQRTALRPLTAYAHHEDGVMFAIDRTTDSNAATPKPMRAAGFSDVSASVLEYGW